MVVQVGDAYIGGQRQRLVGRTHAVQVIHLAVGGVLAMELGAVPGRRARGDIALGLGHRVVRLAQHRVRVGLVGAGVQGRCRVGNA
ncbi:hypothetical protein D3C75_1167110 [compost metagenome]